MPACRSTGKGRDFGGFHAIADTSTKALTKTRFVFDAWQSPRTFRHNPLFCCDLLVSHWNMTKLVGISNFRNIHVDLVPRDNNQDSIQPNPSGSCMKASPSTFVSFRGTSREPQGLTKQQTAKAGTLHTFPRCCSSAVRVLSQAGHGLRLQFTAPWT